MTPTKHTPWINDTDPLNDDRRAVYAQNGGVVASDIMPEDAKLIAAAPELLEVLENLLAVDNPDTLITASWSAEDWKNAKRQYNEAIKSAIQKATQ